MKYYRLTDKKTKSSFSLSIKEFHELNAKTIKDSGSFAFENQYKFQIIDPHNAPIEQKILYGILFLACSLVLGVMILETFVYLTN